MSNKTAPEYLDFSGEGKQTARTLIAKIDDGSFRKAYLTLPDGSRVMAKTRGDMLPEITKIDGPSPFYHFHAIPESEAANWGFDTALNPMNYPNESSPASSRLSISGNGLGIKRNAAWVLSSADATHQQHPGNSVWTDDRLPVGERKKISWWRPQSPYAGPQDMATNIPNTGIGDGLDYQRTDAGDFGWYFDYSGTKTRSGQIYIDGVLTYTLGVIILSAAMQTRGGADYIRVLSPRLPIDPAPEINNVNPWFYGLILYEYNTTTHTLTNCGEISQFTYDPRAPRVPVFNASASKFVFWSPNALDRFQEVNWDAPQSAVSVNGVFSTPVSEALGTYELSVALGLLDGTDCLLVSQRIETQQSVIQAWYEGDTLRALSGLLVWATVSGRRFNNAPYPYTDESSFSGSLLAEYLVFNGVVVEQTGACAGDATWTRSYSYFSGTTVSGREEKIWNYGQVDNERNAFRLLRHDRGAMLATWEKTRGEKVGVHYTKKETINLGNEVILDESSTTGSSIGEIYATPLIYFDLYAFVPSPFGGVGEKTIVDYGEWWPEHLEFSVAEDRKTGIVSCTNQAGSVATIKYLFNGEWRDATSQFSADKTTYLMAPIFT